MSIKTWQDLLDLQMIRTSVASPVHGMLLVENGARIESDELQ